MNAFSRAMVEPSPLAPIFTDDIDAAWSAAHDWGDTLRPGARLVACRWESAVRLEALLDDVIRTLAAAALSEWPNWYGITLTSATSEADFEKSLRLQFTLPQVGREQANILPAWLQRAALRCHRNASPFDSAAPRELQAGQLAQAIGTSVILLCAASPVGSGDDGLVAAAEWLHRVTDARVMLLLPISWQNSSAVGRLNAAAQTEVFHAVDVSSSPPPVADASPGLSVYVSAHAGRPHPASRSEQLLFQRVTTDRELAACLEFNRTVTVDLQQGFRVDILCRAKRIVIEIDGKDHRAANKYAADCERDHRLMMHGYVVLRLPDELVTSDPDLAMERIREVVRWRGT